jgi:NAD(P)-dependent dehydrogenase (short-subunit alcohol dehydrogenase family)
VQDIAALTAFLLSDEAEWINGQAISIDGGSVMQGG